jgi:hypothetical protein
MPHVILCPQCRQQVSVPDNLVGQTVRCPRCEATFLATVPEHPQTPGQAPPTTPYQAEPAAAESPATPGFDQPRAPYGPDTARPRTQRPPVMPHRGTLILVLGILSIVLGCFGLILGPIAWVMGAGDLQEMRLGRMDREGEGLTNAGRICGIVGTLLHAVSLCCCGSWFLLPFGPGRARFHF